MMALRSMGMVSWLPSCDYPKNVTPSSAKLFFSRISQLMMMCSKTRFGKKYFSFLFFIKSTIASYIAVFIVFTIWSALEIDNAIALINHEEFPIILVVILTVCLMLNVLPDYLSVLESRYIIYFMSKTTLFKNHFFLLIIDIILTFMIAISAWLIWTLILNESTILYPFSGDFSPLTLIKQQLQKH